MKTPVDDFDFHLPDELIAQYPAEKRGESRLLVADRETGRLTDDIFKNITNYLDEDHFLVVNNTRVMKARLFGEKPTGGKLELFLLEDRGEGRFLALTRGKVRIGTEIIIGGQHVVLVEDFLEDGVRLVRFVDSDPFAVMEEFGKIPLPPYIEREATDEDEVSYQTVYSEKAGSVAAPTAGLHFTDELFTQLNSQGIERAEVTLEVGLGTFRPVKADYLEDHIMHSERFFITEENAEKINRLKAAGKKLVAVGTTSVRALESAADKNGIIKPGVSSTNIFINPGYEFKAVDKMITNFHLPKSTLLMMISAFWKRENILNTYEHAVREKYRFFSYGDAMFLQ